MPAETGRQAQWRVCADAADLAAVAADLVGGAARAAIQDRGKFRIALAGGNTPRLLYKRLRYLETDWPAWQIFFGDERCLPAGHADRNDMMARTEWLDRVPDTAIHSIPAERGPAEAAHVYAALLETTGPLDVALLGLGEDGHTASLFPGAALGDTADAPLALAVTNAPKPPPERVSLSLRALNASRQIIVMIDGAGKRGAVRAWRSGADLPVARLSPCDKLIVLLTRAADPGA